MDTQPPDVIIVGAGVVGLSIAWELASRGSKVTVVDKQQPGKEASWAGAGILPPANLESAIDPLEQLHGLSHQLHEQWAQTLLEETGIDNGFRKCGGIYVGRKVGEAAFLDGAMRALPEDGITVASLSLNDLVELEPELAPLAETGAIRCSYLLPDEYQLRNPDHLRALVAGCQARGVELIVDHEVTSIILNEDKAVGIATDAKEFHADNICIAAGPWSAQLLDQVGVTTGILPIRGQMVMFNTQTPLLTHIVNEGSRYMVPREDGRLLVGSCEEEVGYEKHTTPDMIQELTEFAYEILPQLKDHTIERTWAGLRPGSFDAFPYIGHVSGFRNLFVASGHFRSGIHLSPATAIVMTDAITEATPSIDLSMFSTLR